MIFVVLYEVHLADGTLIRSLRHFSSNRLQMDARHLHGHHRQPKHHSVIALVDATYAQAEQVYTYLSVIASLSHTWDETRARTHVFFSGALLMIFNIASRICQPHLAYSAMVFFDVMSSAALMRVQKLACLFKQLACFCSYISYFPLLLRKMKKNDVVRMAVFLPLSGWRGG